MISRNASRMLIVAPYIGEFGWELMNWQGRVRRILMSGEYDRVLICSRPDRRALHADSLVSNRVLFCPMPPLNLPGHANDDHRVDDAGQSIPPENLRRIVTQQVRRIVEQLGLDASHGEILTPDYRGQILPTTQRHQLFRSLRAPEEIATDVVLVPRSRRTAEERNQNDSFWRELSSRLLESGLRVENYEPRLDRAIRQLSRARLAVGASTGGLHLASLCGCPHYVWGSGPERRWTAMQITNRQRYETIWNPLGTPCRYDECGWRPAVKHVFEQARQALNEIGIGTVRRPSRLARSRWRIKRRLARMLEPQRHAGLCPWRVRNLVRERLV